MLVLVRRRGNAFDAVIQALKHAGIPVAGADRLKLTEHIAIIDLMNLADALLLPQDDLALAVALKSPLFGLTDDDLFTLAWQRKGSLRGALGLHAATNGKFADALQRLEACERRFATETPFAFYAWLLGGDGGRKRILKRLGHEANDALDEFLELALGYERKAPASLQGFMAWLRAADTEVKRDMEISRDEVRVMTVHGAKGLEAPVVFLVDTTSSPAGYAAAEADPSAAGQCAAARARRRGLGRQEGRRSRRGRRGPRGDARRYRGRIPPPALCGDDARGRPPDRRRLHAGQHEERAQVLLVRPDRRRPRPFGIATAGNRDGRRRGEALFAARGCHGAHNHGRCCRRAAAGPSCRHGCSRPRQPEAPADNLLRPSDPAADERHPVRTGESIQLRAQALLRGTLVHRLLQSLPDVAARSAAATRRCGISPATPATGPTPTAQALAERMLALIGDPRFAPVFAPGSRAEVSIAGRLERPGRPPALVSGQIDRLVVTAVRGPDRRLQDQPRPAGRRSRGAVGLCPPARAVPGGACASFIPSCRSAPRCSGPKPLN